MIERNWIEAYGRTHTERPPNEKARQIRLCRDYYREPRNRG